MIDFSYGDPAANILWRIRLLIGDTDESDPQMNDYEISFFLTDNANNANRAALACCEALQAKYTRLVDVKVDNISESATQRLEQYSKLIAQFRAKLARGGIRPLMGGQSFSEKRSNRDTADLVRPAFTVGQFSEPTSVVGDVFDNPNNE